VKLVRLLSRLALLSLVAGSLAGLTAIYGSSVRPPLRNPRYQAKHRYRPPAPQASQFFGFITAGIELAIFAAAGRVLRLRLSTVPSNEGSPIVLDLNRLGVHSQSMRDPEVGARNSATDFA
jgi:hypothetical protein